MLYSNNVCRIIASSALDNRSGFARLFEYSDMIGMPKKQKCRSIGPYLLPEIETVIARTATPLSGQRPMGIGNMLLDGGCLTLNEADFEDFRLNEPKAVPWIRRLVGGDELVNGKRRWCLWLKDAPESVRRLPLVANRLNDCQRKRKKKSDACAKKLADRPWLFREAVNPQSALAIPRISSEKRMYIPMAFIYSETIPTDKLQIVSDADLWEFGIASSSMHMAWVRTVCGRLKNDYIYSRDLCWNPFPWPSATPEKKERIQQLANDVIDARNKHNDMTLSALYAPETMPEDLKVAHKALDRAVDALYRPEPFESDTERLRLLFKLYEELIVRKGVKIMEESLLTRFIE